MTDLQLAWAAGLFDGEGCISTRDSPRLLHLRVTLRLAMTAERAVRAFRAAVGVGTVRAGRPRAGRLQSFLWCCTHSLEVPVVLGLLKPHLVAKNEEALIAYRYCTLIAPTTAEQEEIRARLLSFKTKHRGSAAARHIAECGRLHH